MIIEKAILKKFEGSKNRSITKTVVAVSSSSKRDHKRAQSFGRGAAKPLGLGKGRKGFEILLQLHSQKSHAGEKKKNNNDKNKNRPADLTGRPAVLWLLHVVQQGT